MRLLLVRHGQSSNNVLVNGLDYAEYIQSRSHEPPLTALGERQAELVGEYLARAGQDETQRREEPFRIDAIYTSPMLRTLQTTAPISRELGIAPEVWVDIHEHGGVFTGNPRNGEVRSFPGLTRAEMAKQFPEYLLPDTVTEAGWWKGGYEEIDACAVRARGAAALVREWSGTRADETILLVTHGTFLDRFIKALLNVPADAPFYFNHLNAAISRIDCFADGFIAVRYLNRAPHLAQELISR